MSLTLDRHACHTPVQGPAFVAGLAVYHPRCHEQVEAAGRGKPHRCPVCDGKGKGAPEYDPRSGYTEASNCTFCDGDGWLAKAPVPQTTTTTRWVKP